MTYIHKIYKTLYKAYGPQKWWPTTLEGDLHPSYHGCKINEIQKFEIIVGAIFPITMLALFHSPSYKY